MGVKDIENEIHRAAGSHDEERASTGLWHTAKLMPPIKRRGRMGKAWFLDVQDHRIERCESTQTDSESDQIFYRLAGFIEPGCGNKLFEQRPFPIFLSAFLAWGRWYFRGLLFAGIEEPAQTVFGE
jgi:hypothetical protein